MLNVIDHMLKDILKGKNPIKKDQKKGAISRVLQSSIQKLYQQLNNSNVEKDVKEQNKDIFDEELEKMKD